MLQDKVALAKKIDALLQSIITNGAFKLKYRITVNPPPPPGGQDLEQPEILVELAGPDSSLLLERGAEMLRSVETIVHESLRLSGEDHDKLSFRSEERRVGKE